jgi:Tfp pilus assembly protein PilO
VSRRILLVTAAVVAVLVFAWYAALWRPASASLAAARAAQATETAKVRTLAFHLSALRDEGRRLSAEEGRLARLEVAVPSSVQVPQVLDELAGAARSSHLSITQESQTLLTPPSTTGSAPASSASGSATAGGAAAAAATLQQLQLSISVQGHYPELMAFLARLGRLPRATITQTLQITASSDATLDATIQAVVFFDPSAEPAPPKQ